MLFKILLIFSTLCIANLTHASIGGYIGPNDQKKLLTVLAKSLKLDPNDVTSSYYGAKGFALFNEKIATVTINDNCAHLKKLYKADNRPEISFQALSAWHYLGCEGKLHTDVTVNTLKAALENDKSTTADLHYALEALKLVNIQAPNIQKISQLIKSRLKQDDNLQSLGHALHAASLLGNVGKFALEHVEEIVMQADEVDGKLLQWEGGLSTTSLLITGLYKIQANKPFNEEQIEKLAAYLLTRRTVQTPKGALALIEAAQTLTSNDLSPVCITTASPAQLNIDNPELKVHITDLLGKPLKTPPKPVVVQSATRISDNVVVLSKQPLNPSTNPIEFVLNLKLQPGQYRLTLTAGNHKTLLNVQISGPIKIQQLEIGLSDADGSSAPRLTKLQQPNKLSTPLQADSSQHLQLKFGLTRQVHQAFLRLFSGRKEIIFVAEPESSSSSQYKIDVNLASELTHSGNFEIELILGDFVMNNPIRWLLGQIDVNLNIPEPQQKSNKGPKPEIEHLFRPAEKRPPEVVSLFFTGLTLAPLLLLLVLWWKIGVNFGNFTILSVPFHLGFGAILGLFTLFWLKLDMFSTCAWLIPIGGFTFLAGQKVLSHIAKHRKG